MKQKKDQQKKLTIEATVSNIETVTNFVNEQLETVNCPMKVQMQIDVAIDELFGNIVHYAYDSGIGLATVRVEFFEDDSGVMVTFIDSGTPYDPCERNTPDITSPAAKREIGGLGIFLVKKLMDEMHYVYQDGKNVLTIIKKFR